MLITDLHNSKLGLTFTKKCVIENPSNDMLIDKSQS